MESPNYDTRAHIATEHDGHVSIDCPYCGMTARGERAKHLMLYSGCTHLLESTDDKSKYGGLLVFFRRKIGD